MTGSTARSQRAHAADAMYDLFAHAPDVSAAGPPAHVQIEQWLMGLIDGGVLLPDDKLPKEKDLAALLGVSRMTLRQSLGSLETRGVLERIPGRQGGTFIRQPRIDCDITGLAGFTEQLRRGHVRASARVVSSDVVPASRAVAKALELPVDEEVYEIVRVRSAREASGGAGAVLPAGRAVPRAAGQAAVGVAVCADAARLRARAADRDGVPRAVHRGPREAEMLSVDEGSALLLIERTARTTSGQPVEYARDLFRPDQVRISVQTVAGQSGALRTANPR